MNSDAEWSEGTAAMELFRYVPGWRGIRGELRRCCMCDRLGPGSIVHVVVEIGMWDAREGTARTAVRPITCRPVGRVSEERSAEIRGHPREGVLMVDPRGSRRGVRGPPRRTTAQPSVAPSCSPVLICGGAQRPLDHSVATSDSRSSEQES